MTTISKDILEYNNSQAPADKAICDLLAKEIDFDEERLDTRGKKFRDASVFYQSADEIDTGDLRRWLGKSREIQWDYKNIVKRKGVLERLK